MGGFEFGEISYLDPLKTLICFIIVICFVVTFDVGIGVMEYYLEGSPIYNRMVQTIYKELMLMGVVSFIIIMVRACRLASDYAAADAGSEWILGIDYAHIVLFFLTAFFVVHALYFMKKSLSSNSVYRRKYTKDLPDMIKELDVVEANPQASFFYYLQYFPFSQLRDQIEFYLMASLFRDTYWLPLEFNFADYLSGCFSRYALKTIDRSFYTWLVILVIVLLNFGRLMLGLEFTGCTRTIYSDDKHGTDDHATDDHPTTDDHHRLLAGTAVPEHKNTACVLSLIKLFLMAAAMLCCYTFIMMLVCRLYKIRLIYRIGFENPGDYNEFLKFTQKQEEKERIAKLISKANPRIHSNDGRTSMEDLKKEVQRVLDEDEHGEEAEFKVVAEFLSTIYCSVSNGINFLLLKVRVVVKYFRSLGSNKTPPAANMRIIDAPVTDSPDRPESVHGTHARSAIGTGPMARVSRTASILGGDHDQPDEDQSKKKQSSGKGRKSLIIQRPLVHNAVSDQSQAKCETGLHQIAEESSIVALDEVRKVEAPNTPITTTNSSAARASNGKGVEKSKVLSMLDQLDFNEDGHAGFLSSKNHVNNKSQEIKAKRKNSVATHCPENIYSIIEKFRKLKVLEKRKERGENYTLALGSHKRTKTESGSGCFGWLFGYNKVDVVKEENIEANPEDEFRLSTDFDDIFFLESPALFYGAVEMCVMFNCLYLAFWITDFIFLAAKMHVADYWHILDQLAMAVPVLVVIPMAGYIIETCSMLKALSELNLDVVHEVIHEAEDTKLLMDDLRAKMMRRIQAIESMHQDKVQIIHALFDEIDQDGSGEIDKVEFRYLLRRLKLTYSNDRFNRLFRAVDTSGDGNLGWDELFNLLFPEDKVSEEKEDEEEDYLRNPNTESGRHQEGITFMNSSDVAALGERIRSVSEGSEYSDTDSDDGRKKNRKKSFLAKSKIESAADKIEQRRMHSTQEYLKKTSEVRELTAQNRSELRQQIYNQLNAENIPGRDDIESVESDD